MKIKKYILLVFSLLLVSCAQEPEDLIAKEQAQKKAQKELDFYLAEQCDPLTAKLMRQKDAMAESLELNSANSATNNEFAQLWSDELNASTNLSFEQEYQAKFNNPIFQNCYRLAKENYANKHRAQQMESRLNSYRYYDDFWYPHGMFFYGVGFHHFHHHHRPHRHHRPDRPPRPHNSSSKP